MALPTTITGISTAIACVGPYISSSGNVYFFGRDSSDSGKIDVQKATDPTSSFSQVASDTSAGGPHVQYAGYQVGDVIHIGIASAISSSNHCVFYLQFDMSSDTFIVTAETVISGVNTDTSAGVDANSVSLVVRSGGEVVAFFNGARVASMGNSYAQTYWSRRTGVNTWSAAAQVSAGGTVNFINPEAVIGASDSVHFLFYDTTNSQEKQRTLSSGNALQTVGSQSSANYIAQAVSYDNAGTQKIVGVEVVSAIDVSFYFDSGNTPALNTANINTTSVSIPTRVFNDTTTVYAVWRKSTDSDLYVASSTDNGATWGSATNIFTGTVAGAEANLSIDGNIFTRGSSVVIPYVVNDNGTLKYNEYVVRTISTFTWYPMDDVGLANEKIIRPPLEVREYQNG